MKDTICILVPKADLKIIRSLSWRDGLAGEGLPPRPESDARTQLAAGEPTPLSVVLEVPHAALWHGCVPTHTLEITR